MKTERLIYLLPVAIIALLLIVLHRSNITVEKLTDYNKIILPAELKQRLLTDTESELLYVDYHNKKLQYYFISKNEVRVRLMLRTMQKLIVSLRYSLPEGHYLAVLHDGAHHTYAVPVLAFATKQEFLDSDEVVLIPDPFATKGYSNTFRSIDASLRKHPWRKKIAKVFFRGSAYGAGYENNDLNGAPRLRFMNYASTLELADVGFTDYTQQFNPEFKSRLAAVHKLKPEVSPADSLAYKYLIDVDGNTCSFARMAWILYSNSLVMKHASNKVQWYYSQMQPFVHYIPIKEDFSDLYAQYIWAEAHPRMAERIAKNGRKLASRVFRYENILESYARAFNHYHTLTLGFAEAQPNNAYLGAEQLSSSG